MAPALRGLASATAGSFDPGAKFANPEVKEPLTNHGEHSAKNKRHNSDKKNIFYGRLAARQSPANPF
jgi:hypothetical protein